MDYVMASRRSTTSTTPAADTTPVSVTETAVAPAVLDGHVMLTLDIDNLTAESLEGATVADIDALTIKVGAEYAKRTSDDTIRAAKATHLAFASGILTPKGETKAAHAITPAAFAERFQAGRTNVYTWRVIGKAIMVHNIDAEHLGLMLSKNLAQYTPLVEAIDAADATTESVHAAIKASIGADGKRLSMSRPKAIKPAEGDTVGQVQNDEGALVPVGRDLAGLSALMFQVVTTLGLMSAEDYAKGVDMVSTLLAECDAARQAAIAAA
jgi:hypothetical protein